MTRQDFHPTETGMKPFVNFCSRIEATEAILLEDKPTSSSRRHNAKRERSKGTHEPTSSKQEYYCKIHRSNVFHDTVDCKARQKKRRKFQSDYSDRCRERRIDLRLPKTTQELNAIISYQVKKAFQKKTQKKHEVNILEKNCQVKLSGSEDSDAGENTSVKSDDKEVSFVSDSKNSNPFNSSSEEDSDWKIGPEPTVDKISSNNLSLYNIDASLDNCLYYSNIN